MERIRPGTRPTQPSGSAPAPRPSNSGPSIPSKVLVISLVVIGIVFLIAMGVFLFSGGTSGSAVKEDKYQAVFLSNGQVYFGKLANINDSYATLENIFYLQVNQQNQQELQEGENNAGANPDISLAKLGTTELHCPEDQMYISRDQILFWENLQDEGDVVSAINEYENSDQQGPQCSDPDQQNGQNGTAPAPQQGTEPQQDQ